MCYWSLLIPTDKDTNDDDNKIWKYNRTLKRGLKNEYFGGKRFS
jgi:hypothetical protein